MTWDEVNIETAIKAGIQHCYPQDFPGRPVILEHLPWKDSGNVLFGSSRCAQHLKAVFSAFGDHDEIMCY